MNFSIPFPFIGNVSNKVGEIKIQHLLNGIKDKKIQSGVFEIPCGTCNHKYYGETERNLETRRDEHGVREYTKSAVARHLIRNKGHEISWNGPKIILNDNNHHLRLIKEGLAKQQSKFPVMNTKKGLATHGTALSQMFSKIIESNEFN